MPRHHDATSPDIFHHTFSVLKLVRIGPDPFVSTLLLPGTPLSHDSAAELAKVTCEIHLIVRVHYLGKGLAPIVCGVLKVIIQVTNNKGGASLGHLRYCLIDIREEWSLRR